MKSIAILRMRPGADVQEEALRLFLTHGPTASTEWLLASLDSKTYISLSTIDEPDLAGLAMYAPFFDIESFPVVETDADWIAAMQTAVGRRDRPPLGQVDREVGVTAVGLEVLDGERRAVAEGRPSRSRAPGGLVDVVGEREPTQADASARLVGGDARRRLQGARRG